MIKHVKKNFIRVLKVLLGGGPRIPRVRETLVVVDRDLERSNRSGDEMRPVRWLSFRSFLETLPHPIGGM